MHLTRICNTCGKYVTDGSTIKFNLSQTKVHLKCKVPELY